MSEFALTVERDGPAWVVTVSDGAGRVAQDFSLNLERALKGAASAIAPLVEDGHPPVLRGGCP